MLPTLNYQKSVYTEAEAAQRLGVTVEQLRGLVQDKIVPGDAISAPVSTFSSTDLVMLRMLAQQLAHTR